LIIFGEVQGDPITCGYIQEQRLKAKKEASGECCSEMKEELQELKQTVDSVVAELWQLKMKFAEPIHEPKPAAK
jgi:hypothetical protein